MANSIIGRSLNDDLYTIRFTDQNELELLFVDFKYDIDENNSDYFGPDIFTQKTKVFKKRIEIINDDIIKSVNDTIYSEFTKMAKIEGLLNRDKSKMGDKFDIDFKKWEIDLKKTGSDNIPNALLRRLVAKINNCSNFIATDGRIGPAQFVITNEKTHNFFERYSENYMNLGFIRYYINNELEDCDIILGRKNESTQPGVLFIMNENNIGLSKRVFSEQDPYGEEDWDNGNIEDIELITIGDKKYIDLAYSFVPIGFYPEKQFYYIHLINND
jgi:hypothetical protein